MLQLSTIMPVYLDVFQPMSSFQVCEPANIVNCWKADILELTKAEKWHEMTQIIIHLHLIDVTSRQVKFDFQCAQELFTFTSMN